MDTIDEYGPVKDYDPDGEGCPRCYDVNWGHPGRAPGGDPAVGAGAMSRISTDADISEPRFAHAWRAESGSIHAAVYLSRRSSSTLTFDSAADARALAAECIEAAEALDKLAEGGAP